MAKKNLMILCGLIFIVLVLLIGLFTVYIAISTDNSAAILNSTNSYAENSVFDNKTPEEKAIFIARLSQGHGCADDFYNNTANASLTPDGKFWVVEIDSITGEEAITVLTVDAKTWVSKEDNGRWKSLDELKASYIANVYCDQTQNLGPGKPYTEISDGKTIWKVPIYSYDIFDDNGEFWGNVYFDPTTGKSIFSEYLWDLDNEFIFYNGGGKTLKELDDTMNFNPYGETPFRNALRDLYPE